MPNARRPRDGDTQRGRARPRLGPVRAIAGGQAAAHVAERHTSAPRGSPASRGSPRVVDRRHHAVRPARAPVDPGNAKQGRPERRHDAGTGTHVLRGRQGGAATTPSTPRRAESLASGVPGSRRFQGRLATAAPSARPVSIRIRLSRLGTGGRRPGPTAGRPQGRPAPNPEGRGSGTKSTQANDGPAARGPGDHPTDVSVLSDRS